MSAGAGDGVADSAGLAAELIINEHPDGTRTYTAFCHLCPKAKQAESVWRVLYMLAFHYDRRHRGWTDA